MKPSIPSPWRATLTVSTLSVCLCISPTHSRAGADGPAAGETGVRVLALGKTGMHMPETNEVGVRLLEAELLPTKVTLLKAKCDPVVIAVGKTTLAHPRDALVILHAALTRRVMKMRGEELATLPCTCARRIFLASVAAAPKRSSELFDLATELYPDCTPEFAEALRTFESRGQGASGPGGNDAASDAAPSDNANMQRPMGDSLSHPTNPGDNDGSASGSDAGIGAGFPGAPGFTGSSPGGGLALPPVAVTSVVNG